MNTADFARKVYSMVELNVQSHPPSIQFELAYQARLAAERIRFAVRQIETSPQQPDALREANMQLLDALDRLECAERRFQALFCSRLEH